MTSSDRIKALLALLPHEDQVLFAAAWAAAARAGAERHHQLDDLQRLLAGDLADDVDLTLVKLDEALEKGLDPVVATWPHWARAAAVRGIDVDGLRGVM